MSLDGFVIRAIVHEWQSLIGSKINKIHQPTEHDIVLQIRANSQTLRLLISAHPTYPRAFITNQTFVNPLEAPMFCMLLRKYIEGGIIENISQVEFERIIHMQIRHRDELGDIRQILLVIELMGRHSNLILIDPASGQIIDGIHHVTPVLSRYRVVMPGSPYKSPPEQHKLNLLSITESMLKQIWTYHPSTANTDVDVPSSKTLLSQLVESISGMSPLLAKELIYQSCLNDSQMDLSNEEMLRFWSVLNPFQHTVLHHDFQPVIVKEKNSDKSFFSIVDLTHIEGHRSVFANMQLCLETYYGNKAEKDLVKQKVADLYRFLQNELKKNEKKHEKLQHSRTEATEADQFRKIGELLTSQMHLVQKNMNSVQVIDYYEESQPLVEISLEPMLSPAENAQRYFKKYNKLNKSLQMIEQQLTQTEIEISYLHNLLHQLETASLSDIEEIRQELIAQHYLKERQVSKRKIKKQDKPKLSCYLSSKGTMIFVGKNNTQNEFLTHRFAYANETWLHTKSIPGSHVLIRSNTLDEVTLYEAAQIAAYFSQARYSSSVPVDYTLIKHVHKPNGAKPGFVTYDHQKTLYVTPDEHWIQSLIFKQV